MQNIIEGSRKHEGVEISLGFIKGFWSYKQVNLIYLQQKEKIYKCSSIEVFKW